jgi:hypothetical protein
MHTASGLTMIGMSSAELQQLAPCPLSFAMHASYHQAGKQLACLSRRARGIPRCVPCHLWQLLCFRLTHCLCAMQEARARARILESRQAREASLSSKVTQLAAIRRLASAQAQLVKAAAQVCGVAVTQLRGMQATSEASCWDVSIYQ